MTAALFICFLFGLGCGAWLNDWAGKIDRDFQEELKQEALSRIADLEREISVYQSAAETMRHRG